MMKKNTIIALAAALGMGAMLSARATTTIYDGFSWTGYGADSYPGWIITWNGSSGTVTGTGQGPYDGSDDTYVGVINNGSTTLYSLNLSAGRDPANGGYGIFDFDGDGIQTYGSPHNGSDTTGYGGPTSYFSNIVLGNPNETGTVNFIGGIAPGGYTYFSLEDNLANITGGTTGLNVTSPDGGSTMLLLGSVLGALGMLRRRFVG